MNTSKVPGYIFFKIIKSHVDNRPCSHSVPLLISASILKYIVALFPSFLPTEPEALWETVLNTDQKFIGWAGQQVIDRKALITVAERTVIAHKGNFWGYNSAVLLFVVFMYLCMWACMCKLMVCGQVCRYAYINICQQECERIGFESLSLGDEFTKHQRQSDHALLSPPTEC